MALRPATSATSSSCAAATSWTRPNPPRSAMASGTTTPTTAPAVTGTGAGSSGPCWRGSRWTRRGPTWAMSSPIGTRSGLPVSRERAKGTSSRSLFVDDLSFLIGGRGRSSFLDTSVLYHAEDMSFSEGPDLPREAASFCLLHLNDTRVKEFFAMIMKK